MIAVDARPPTRESRTISRRVSHDAFVELRPTRYPRALQLCRASLCRADSDRVRIVLRRKRSCMSRELERHREIHWQGAPRAVPPDAAGATRPIRRTGSIRPGWPGRSGCSPAARCLRSAGQRGLVMTAGLQYERLSGTTAAPSLVQSGRAATLAAGSRAKRELSYSDFLESCFGRTSRQAGSQTQPCASVWPAFPSRRRRELRLQVSSPHSIRDRCLRAAAPVATSPMPERAAARDRPAWARRILP